VEVEYCETILLLTADALAAMFMLTKILPRIHLRLEELELCATYRLHTLNSDLQSNFIPNSSKSH